MPHNPTDLHSKIFVLSPPRWLVLPSHSSTPTHNGIGIQRHMLFRLPPIPLSPHVCRVFGHALRVSAVSLLEKFHSLNHQACLIPAYQRNIHSLSLTDIEHTTQQVTRSDTKKKSQDTEKPFILTTMHRIFSLNQKRRGERRKDRTISSHNYAPPYNQITP